MDQKNNASHSYIALLKQVNLLFISTCFFLGLLIAIPFSIVGYRLGYINGKQQVKVTSVINKSKIIAKQQSSMPGNASPTLYTLSYTIPVGWRSIIWNPTTVSTSSAIVSPDYIGNDTAHNDLTPRTGIAVFIYRYPELMSSLQELRAKTEESEDNMQKITQTVVSGFPAYHAIFVSTDSNRVLDQYHILKGTDHWVINFVLPGNSLPAAQYEEQRYSVAFNELLQSVQFQEYYNSIQQ
ncbi:MAG TPA: hypothetical protein VNW29_02405 [Candidatus Sulfotelmatobacter sp.]|jgi:hypothetical protein|nr:hypothetical protein [Candidatus Sulfotelmatobacter sp.]